MKVEDQVSFATVADVIVVKRDLGLDLLRVAELPPGLVSAVRTAVTDSENLESAIEHLRLSTEHPDAHAAAALLARSLRLSRNPHHRRA